MEAGLETRFDGNPLHFRILTGYAGLCRQQCPLRGRGGDSRQLWFPVSFLLRRMTGCRIRTVAAALCVPLPES